MVFDELCTRVLDAIKQASKAGHHPNEVWLGPEEALVLETEVSWQLTYKAAISSASGLLAAAISADMEQVPFMGMRVRLMKNDGVRVGISWSHAEDLQSAPNISTMNNGIADPKGAAGALKTPLHLLPPEAKRAAAMAHKLGAEKYGPYNWRHNKVEVMTYLGAMQRHIDEVLAGIDLDEESGEHHLAHVIAGCNIVLDARHHGTLIDNRPHISPTAENNEY